jgi:hypothetical protein
MVSPGTLEHLLHVGEAQQIGEEHRFPAYLGEERVDRHGGSIGAEGARERKKEQEEATAHAAIIEPAAEGS